MRILVDITHPVHVHLFRHVIQELKARGHEVMVTAADKDVTLDLLRLFGIDHVRAGSYGRSVTEKALRLLWMDYELLRVARRFKPDLLLAEAPVRASHVAYFIRRPCIGLDDTECAQVQRRLWLPFVTRILTPKSYELDLGRKQIRYPGYKELAYLHPRRFTPDPSAIDADGLRADEPFAFVRFVSWQATHDVGQGGFSREGRLCLVQQLSQYGRVLISSEGGVAPELEGYVLKAPPHLMHHLLYYASVCVSEGATVASESAVLGTPAVYMNSLRLGYLQEQQDRYGLVLNIHDRKDEDGAIAAAVSVMQQAACRRPEWRVKAAQLVQDHVDVTEYLVETLMRVKRVDGR